MGKCAWNFKLPEQVGHIHPQRNETVTLLATTDTLIFNLCQINTAPHVLQKVEARVLFSHLLRVAWIWIIISQAGCGIFYFCTNGSCSHAIICMLKKLTQSAL